MKCANHPELDAVAFCRECGKPMCGECQLPAAGSVWCSAHAPATAGAAAAPPPLPAQPAVNPSYAQQAPPSPYAAPSPYTAPAYTAAAMPVQDTSVYPILAGILGFIPGVGAIYNGQYAKGLVHAVVFGLLVSLIERANGNLEPLFGILLAAWVFYMVFEAYHTARKRRHGIAVEEFSSLIDVRSVSGQNRFPVSAVVLILVGVVLLLNTTDIIDFALIERFWPVGLIALGLYLLYNRMSGPKNSDVEAPR
jgi:hypothetical protein